jgi:hypothetical protein
LNCRDGSAQQIVGRERRERVSHHDWSDDAFVNSRRRVNSNVRLLLVNLGPSQDFMKLITALLATGIFLLSSLIVQAQQSDALTFKMEICGRGIAPVLSGQSYSVSDGTNLGVTYYRYRSARDATKALAKELKLVRRIEDRKQMTGKDGKKIDEYIVATILEVDGKERTAWFHLQDYMLTRIDAASLRHIEEFLKMLTATEQIVGRERRGRVSHHD